MQTNYIVNRDKIRENLNMLGIVRVFETLKISEQSQYFNLLTDRHLENFFYPEDIPIVEAWIEEQKVKEVQLSRDKELSIAKEANEIAKKANQFSLLAAAISAISLIASAFALWWK